jgi:DNA-binding transcriptional LysR family regulator
VKISQRQLEYIYNVLDLGSISHAAQKSFVSQPAMSQCVRDFESDNGVSLFERKGRKLYITHEGEQIKMEIAALLESMRTFEERFDEIVKGQLSHVTVGIPPVILTVYFYEVISQFMVENRDIDLKIVELGAEVLKNQLLQGEIDITVLIEPLPLPVKNFQKKTLVEDTFSIVLNRDHALSKRNTLTLEDIKNEKLVSLNEDFQIYHVIVESYSQHGIKPDIVFKSKQWDLLLNMVAHNATLISILPTPIVSYYKNDDLVAIPVDLVVNWQVVLAYTDDAIDAEPGKRFIDYATEWFI